MLTDPEIAEQQVGVERRAVEEVAGGQEPGAGADQVERAEPEHEGGLLGRSHVGALGDVGRQARVARLDDEAAERARVVGSQQRHHQERPLADAPDAERLAERLAVLLETDAAADVEEPEHADGGVDGEAPEVADRLDGLPLQEAVDGDTRLGEVVEEVVDALLERVGHDDAVAPRDGLEHGVVERGVERVDAPVGVLERVVDRSRRRVARAAAGQGERGGQENGRGERGTVHGGGRRHRRGGGGVRREVPTAGSGGARKCRPATIGQRPHVR